jgi:hypothetical protein
MEPLNSIPNGQLNNYKTLYILVCLVKQFLQHHSSAQMNPHAIRIGLHQKQPQKNALAAP